MSFKQLKLVTIAGRQVVINVDAIDFIIENTNSSGQCTIYSSAQNVEVGYSIERVLSLIKEVENSKD